MKFSQNTQLELQNQMIKSGNPSIELHAPCRINDGILQIPKIKQLHFIDLFSTTKKAICFFVPASGSGSRMFQFLFDFLNSPNELNRSEVERFLHAITEFAFFKQLPFELQSQIENHEIDLETFISYLLLEEGMGYGALPKGLIPFHHVEPFILTPFQEHILQAMRLKLSNTKFHFTIQSKYVDSIKEGMNHISGLTGYPLNIDFSEQSIASNAFVFTENGEALKEDNGDYITRPAGHGALLENLQSIDADIVFVKNIDNVQHYKYAPEIESTWKLLGGLVLEVQSRLAQLNEHPNYDDLVALNQEFQLYSPSEMEMCRTDLSFFKQLIHRPVRACGMVKNEGQPGGGPFWVNEHGKISKQIVEKAQISMLGEQYRLMVQSTHFNPVIMALGMKDFNGKAFDLNEFKDESKYFVVDKNHQGQKVKFVELPGLWNGSMAEWTTIFIEIPSSNFSPVKTVLDLLNYAHRAY